MLYRVKKRFFRDFREQLPGDIINISKDEAKYLTGYIEKYSLKSNSETEFTNADTLISEEIKHKNKIKRR